MRRSCFLLLLCGKQKTKNKPDLAKPKEKNNTLNCTARNRNFNDGWIRQSYQEACELLNQEYSDRPPIVRWAVSKLISKYIVTESVKMYASARSTSRK